MKSSQLYSSAVVVKHQQSKVITQCVESDLTTKTVSRRRCPAARQETLRFYRFFFGGTNWVAPAVCGSKERGCWAHQHHRARYLCTGRKHAPVHRPRHTAVRKKEVDPSATGKLRWIILSRVPVLLSREFVRTNKVNVFTFVLDPRTIKSIDKYRQ